MPQSAEEGNIDDAKVNGVHNGARKVEVEDMGVVEKDDFGLPIRKRVVVERKGEDNASMEEEDESVEEKEVNGHLAEGKATVERDSNNGAGEEDSESEDEFKDARSTPNPQTPNPHTSLPATPQPEMVQLTETRQEPNSHQPKETVQEVKSSSDERQKEESKPAEPKETKNQVEPPNNETPKEDSNSTEKEPEASEPPKSDMKDTSPGASGLPSPNQHTRGQSSTGGGISEWSHQHITQKPEEVKEEEDEWQPMPAFAPYDIYDDDNKLVAKEAIDSDDEAAAYDNLGGAGKGYTRVQLDEDAQSATSLDENTQYLFKDVNGGTGAGEMENEEQRDAVSQMQATKDLLTEGQRIAYVGMTRLILSIMADHAESMIDPKSKSSKKELQLAAEAMKMWGQKMMVRLYAHMEISTAEQIMIEQLSEHGVVPEDLTPTLMQNARVKNPMADEKASTAGLSSPRPSSMASTDRSPRPSVSSPRTSMTPQEEEPAAAPPPYKEHEGEDLPEVRTPSQLPTTANLDIDLRLTVLCDLFLTLIADSVYDARSRVLLEKVGENMKVDWLEICRFEKRVTDALEMQQAAEKENWNEDEHKENRRKMALKKRYIMMGLATVGGGLVIGLSAGLLAPVIGAGLAAGFTTIGVAGTSGFLAGAGGAAIITSGAAASGGIIAVRAANRRTGAVKTFEYRPLHNNKRVNLIVTVSGWMTGKIDDVRLPYSTVDPIMGDIYSVLWEPEMLTSMGDTINILATEVSQLRPLGKLQTHNA